MKKNFFFAMLLGIFFQSCSKTSSPVNNQIPFSQINIIGKWKWINSQSMFTGVRTPSPDSIVQITFNADSTYIVSVNDLMRRTGRFTSSVIPYNIPDSTVALAFDADIQADRLSLLKNQVILLWNNENLQTKARIVLDEFNNHNFRKN